MNDVNWLLTLEAVREQSQKIFELIKKGDLNHFDFDQSAVAGTAKVVSENILKNYPDGKIPNHSRNRQFEAIGQDWFEQAFAETDANEIGPLLTELTIVSVLTDAGAGDLWKYRHEKSGQILERSEGLAIACLDLVASGTLGEGMPRVTIDGLKKLDTATFEKFFQVRSENPLVGCSSRVALLNRLGEVFGRTRSHQLRLGDLFSEFTEHPNTTEIFARLIELLGGVWMGRTVMNAVELGDCWHHPGLGDQAVATMVPFHKLTQWLTYSLIDVLTVVGVEVSHQDALTGLPEYRNGGLLVDTGVLIPQFQASNNPDLLPSHPAIVEWRAATVCLLDELRSLVSENLERPLTMAQLLQGGTWSAGRSFAKQRRGGLPPIQIVSDGTVF